MDAPHRVVSADKAAMAVTVTDTTLRDGQQREGVHLTLQDKLRVAARLDAAGFHYIEAGFPAATPVDEAFFDAYGEGRLQLACAKLVAFGITRRKGCAAAEDDQLATLAACSAPVVTVVGKARLSHVRHALGVSPEENLAMVGESVAFLVAAGKEVFFAAEHFFDGFAEDAAYALQVGAAAAEAGASILVLCDTNGGMLPHQAYQTTAEAVSAAAAWRRPGATPCAIGIHAHDDSGCAVANTLEAVRAGATHVQGTVNGYGERVGNADLLTAVADMELKLGIEVIGRERLKGFTSLARYVAEAFNIAPDAHQPYVGASAFTHKGGLHASGSERLPGAYEHVNPEAVGNLAHVVISDLAGKASLKNKAAELGIALPAGETGLAELLAALKSREARGFSYEMADASLALFVQGELGCATQAFRLESFRVIADKHADGRVMCEATIKIHVGGERHVATAEGNGPVNALDKALRMAIRRFYPQIDCLHLSDYKVRVLDESIGTGAVTRVGIVTTDGERSWGTIGVSENIIEASWDALVDSISFALQ